uniref:DEP domain-containing protein n=1 Tax=Kalanchoe fedtschenkoi TaxID=63787 RepID=A0A7N0V754_KALFE
MDKENLGDTSPKIPPASGRMEGVALDAEGIGKGHSREMANSEKLSEDVNVSREKDDMYLPEEKKSENVSEQETRAVNDGENVRGDQSGDSPMTEISVGVINEEVTEKAQLEEVQSPSDKVTVEEMRNERNSTDAQGNHSEPLTAGEAKTTEVQKKDHEYQLRANTDQGNQPEDKNVIEKIQKLETADNEVGNVLIETASPITNNMDGTLEKEKKNNEVGNHENEGEHSGLKSTSPEKSESLDSDNEVKDNQPKTEKEKVALDEKLSEKSNLEPEGHMEKNIDGAGEALIEEMKKEPVFDGTEVPGMEASKCASSNSLNADQDSPGTVSETAVAIKNFVKQKSSVAVSAFIRRLSGKKGDDDDDDNEGSDDGKEKTEDPKAIAGEKNQEEVTVSVKEPETEESSQKTAERSTWNPLTFLMMSRDSESKAQVADGVEGEPILPITMKGRIILYTRLGCQACKEARLYLHQKRLGYVEVNIDVYPSRKSELEKISGSSSVPKIFFNEVLIGGLSEIKTLDESGKLAEKIDYLIAEAPSIEAPLPPLSGEDDESNNGTVDENAAFVQKMRESIMVRDRFQRLRRFTSCFLGSDAVNFISEDQYLEREEAIQFGRKLASEFFFLHVFEENLFEDGNHLYRFLDQDPIVVSQCQNIPRGILDVKPKPITEIASRLRFLQYAMLEAYATEDGRHVDYRSIHGSEEFARYLRTVEELQRVDLQDMQREEKLAFFINLYNMMAIHVILVWGHPTGALERRRVFGDFKYVVGGCTYSLSAIQNGILRVNQRPPYNLVKPFGAKDRRAKLVLPFVEPLIHFALVCGTRSSPALRCYSPGNIDKELKEAAWDFVKTGGLVVDLSSKAVSVSKTLKWFSVDFGKNETELLKHVANYLDPPESEAMLELLANNQLKVNYQPYDWGLNH